MAKTKSEMFTLIGANLPDNTTGQITPAGVREVFTQLADSALYAAAGVKEVEVLRAASTSTQLPTALGTALQLTLGGAQNSASNPVMINATAGQTMAIQIERDSEDSSINAGGVYAIQPATSGWAAAPSALLVISRLEAV